MVELYAAAERLARAWCADGADRRAMLAAAREIFGPAAWLPPLVKRARLAMPSGHAPRPSELRRFLLADARFRKACGVEPLADSRGVVPASLPMTVADLPTFRTTAELAAWLELTPGELAWFADLREWSPDGEHPLSHYCYRWFHKRQGGVRLIESPKPRLNAIQRRILTEILDRVPPHDAAHGFRRGRDIASCTLPHCGRAAVLRLDLRDFFPSITRPRVAGLFITSGYRPEIATLLAGLCTHATSDHVWDAFPWEASREVRRESEQLYRRRHLPQGAPTSPALANLCAFGLDVRLAGLARTAGAVYTRYADDLIFSGDETFARSARRLLLRIGAIAAEESFPVQWRKMRLMRQGVRQEAAGLVLNAHPNVRRSEYDELKAIVHNCVRFGPTAQNRARHPHFREHLLGRIQHLARFHAARGSKLMDEFETIEWS